MKRQRIPTVVLCALCLITVIGVGWFVINRSGVPAAHENEDGHAVERNADAAPKDHGEANVVLKRASDLPGGQMREEFGGGELARLPIREPLPYRIRHAVTYGAKAKITLRVADSKGVPVADALVGGGFYNHDEKGHDFKERTNEKGEVTLEGTCVGDLNFGVMKDGYYSTETTYWFFKNYFDCVKDGRWIPWNPTVEIMLKEIRNPVPLYTRRVEALLPKGQEIGFDCLEGDFIIPFGKGENADFYMTYESVIPSNAVTLYDWSFLTNSLSLVATESGGFITHKKDSFSKMAAQYEAPETGYTSVVGYEMRRTHDKIFVNEKLNESEYLFFKTRVRRKPDGREEACYGKVYELVFGEYYAETNKAKISMAYYFNPTQNDRNLEFDGKNNLFKPDWRDTSWPREP
ncbi:MAG: hypothetical protein WC328_15845 [Kiritimatiellia bacterium]